MKGGCYDVVTEEAYTEPEQGVAIRTVWRSRVQAKGAVSPLKNFRKTA